MILPPSLQRLSPTSILAILFLLQNSGLALEHQGHWDRIQRRWISGVTDSQLPNLVGPFEPDISEPEKNATRLIFFGDSNDRYLVNDFCAKAEPYPARHDVSEIRGCWHKNLTLTWQPIVGVHPHGPYYQENTGTPFERIRHGMQAQNATFGAPPDLVTFSSNLWDLGQWATATSTLLVNRQVEAQQLRRWSQHTSIILKQIEVRRLLAPWRQLRFGHTNMHRITEITCSYLCDSAARSMGWSGNCDVSNGRP